MKRRLLPSIPLSLTVFLFWLLMAEDYGPGSIVMGLLLAWLMPLLASRMEREFARLGKLRVVWGLAARVLRDILVANLTVARQVLGAQHKLRSHFVWIPLDLTNIHGISALTSLITLTPGTISAELSDDRRYLLIHCLSSEDPQALADEIKQRYEAPLREIFP